MKLSLRTVVYGLLGLAAVVVLAARLYMEQASVAVSNPTAVASAAPRPPGVVTVTVPPEDGSPLDDVTQMGEQNSRAALSASAWLSARSRRYRALLADWHCDTLLLPVQTEGSGFDQATRELMAGMLARALSAQGCVTDPYLIDLVLGEGLRRRSEQDIQAIAGQLRASTIVALYAGHDMDGKMRITLRVQKQDPDHPDRAPQTVAHSLDGLAFNDGEPPFIVFESHLSQLLSVTGLSAASRPKTATGQMPAQLPGASATLGPGAGSGVLPQAMYLSFLGMLAPAPESRTAERLFTKAWLLTRDIEQPGPAVRRLQARLMMHLMERPYGLALIADDSSAEAAGLRAILNGNLPEARQAKAGTTNSWDQFFLGLEVHDLELDDARDARSTARRVLALLPDHAWDTLVKVRLADGDMWTVPDNLDIKKQLDEIFPIPGFKLNDAAMGSVLLGRTTEPADLQLLAVKHVHRLLEQQPRQWCCKTYTAAPQPMDLLDLFEARTESALLRQIHYYNTPQAAYESALKLAERYSAELSGNPQIESDRVYAYSRLLGRGEIERRDERQTRLREAARTAALVAQGQSSDSYSCMVQLITAPADALAPALSMYGTDYPMRPYWYHGMHNATQRLAYSNNTVRPLSDLIAAATEPGDRQKLVAELEGRFRGNPDATELWLSTLPKADNVEDRLRHEITLDPDNWTLYGALADKLFLRHAYDDVAKAVLAFPRFSEAKPYDNVNLGNNAFDWGMALLKRGAVDAARPLLAIPAGYRNGSSASHFAQARLSMLDQDWRTAISESLANAQHYLSFSAYRRFLDLAFVAGHEREAWATFDQLISNYRAPEIWWSAMVGHRHAGLERAALQPWLSARIPAARAASAGEDLMRYAVAETLMDRSIPADATEALRTLSETLDDTVGPDGKIHGQQEAEGQSTQRGPSRFGAERHPALKPGTLAENRYALLAAAFADMDKAQYSEAVDRFDKLSSYYSIEDGPLTFVLPYFALAAAKSGDTHSLQQFLKTLPDNYQQGYDVVLARAVFAALAGNRAAADTELDTALHESPDASETRYIQSAYEYMDICMRLFELSGEAHYRERALQLARTMRRIEPVRAYGHAFVAYASADEQERIEALALALYLDPQSRWASKSPAGLKTKAEAWLKLHPPFQLDRAAAHSST